MDIKASVLQRVSEWERAALDDECRHCAIRSSALFAELTDEDFERIHRPIDRVRLAPGAVIFNDGDAAEALFTVRRGAVKIEHVLPDGRSRITAMHHAGDLIGLSGYAARRHDARAVALTEVELCRLPVSLLRELEACSPRLQAGLEAKWLAALREANAWLTELSVGSIGARVARLLLKFPADPEDRITVCSRQDMGAMLGGVALETVSRVMSRFQREGVLESLDRVGRVYRADLAALRRIAADG